MFYTKLDVVNRCLAAMGELPVNTTENSTNPMVTTALETLNQVTLDEQGIGWWFNTEVIKLMPQTDGTYAVPTDVMSLYTLDNFNPGWLHIRGRFLYNSDGGERYTGDRPVRLKVIRALPFEDLPFNAQKLVRASTVERFINDYDGDQQKLETASNDYTAAYTLCNADHIRAVKANMLTQGGMASDRIRQRVPTGRWRP